jgi:hypothetical protein
MRNDRQIELHRAVLYQLDGEEWALFPGGELEGRRPTGLCGACLERSRHAVADSQPVLCFQCYRVGLARDRALAQIRELTARKPGRGGPPSIRDGGPLSAEHADRRLDECGRARSSLAGGPAVSGSNAVGSSGRIPVPGVPGRAVPSSTTLSRFEASVSALATERHDVPANPAGLDMADAVSAPEDRWQWLLPFEPVNRPRLERLRAARATTREANRTGPGRYEDRRRRAQMAARRALETIAEGLMSRSGDVRRQEAALASAAHAAELQLPESWLPFVAGSR